MHITRPHFVVTTFCCIIFHLSLSSSDVLSKDDIDMNKIGMVSYGGNKQNRENICNVTQTTTTGEKLVWNHAQGDGLFSATPHCLNEDRVFELANCTNGKLEHPITCSSVQQRVSACPSGFNEEGEHCVAIFESSYDAGQCPPGYLDYSIVGKDFKTIWLPVRRDLQYGIGELVYDGMPHKTSIVYAGDYDASTIVGYDCLTYSGGKFKTANCNEIHRRLCHYWTMQHNDHHHCSNIDSECRGSLFDPRNLLCLCSRSYGINAILRYPYQNRIYFTNTTSLGLIFDKNLKWMTGESVTYTFWANKNLTDFKDTMTIIHTGDGWGVSTIETEYKLCEVNYTFRTPSISISEHDYLIIVDIENPFSFAMNEDKFIIFCYSDTMAYHLYDIQFRYAQHMDISANFPAFHSGYYWCEGYSVANFDKISSGKILVVRHNIFTIEIVVNYTWYSISDDPTRSSVAYNKFIFIIDQLFSRDLTDFEVRFKWMKTLQVNEEAREVRYLIHISTEVTNGDDEFTHYTEISSRLWKIDSYDWIKYVSELYHYKYCMPDVTQQSNKNITWMLTEAGSSTNANQRCLNEQGYPVLRMCSSDFYEGARWLKPQDCYAVANDESKWTEELSALLEEDDADEILGSLEQITANAHDFVPVDIYQASSILHKVSRNESLNMKQVTRIVNNIMQSKYETLRESQISLNATDRILYYFDIMIKHNKRANSGDLFTSPNVILFTIDVAAHNLSGLALVKHSGQYLTMKLSRGVTHDFIYNIPNLEVATFLPEQLLNLIEKSDDTYVSFTFFLSDVLFNEETLDREVIATNVAVLLPELERNAAFKIPIIFRPSKKLARRNRDCGYWNYGNIWESNLKGSWDLETHPVYSGRRTKFFMCEYNHATHFGLLLSNTRLEYSNTLDMITLVCISLSLAGIMGILITAVLFRTWLDSSGNKILVNYCIVSSVQIILIFISFKSQENYEGAICIFVGALLQYTITAQFIWMFIIGIFQYKRYVKVLHGPKMWIFQKTCTVCYTLSAIPVLVLLIFFQETYLEGGMGFCYPSGNALTFGVTLPIGIIVVANCVIFSIIIFELFCKKGPIPSSQDDTFFLRLGLVTLLFFMMGITWAFGILAQMCRNIVLEFIFCITASLQGFALFVFFVLLNKKVRSMYMYLWRDRSAYRKK